MSAEQPQPQLQEQQQSQSSDNGELLSEEEFKRIEEEEDAEEEEVINEDDEQEGISGEGEEAEEDDRGDESTDVIRDGSSEQIDDSDNLEQESDKKKPNEYIAELNQERKIQRKKASIAFLIEYSKGPHRNHSTVSDKLGIGTKTGYKYLKEFIDVIKKAVSDNRYPDQVLEYYNDIDIEDEKRLKFHHIDHLREVILKYSNYDIAKRLNTSNSDNYKSNKQVSVDDLSILDNLHPSSSSDKEDNKPIQQQDSDFHDVYRLEYGITPYQLLRFGLLNVYDQSIRNRASQMIGPDPTEYFMSEKKMKDLLMMLNNNSHQADRFVEWLKNGAKYVAHPIGFLINPFSVHPLGGNGTSSSSPAMMAMQSQPDPMDEYYYISGIYIKNLPPDHPANQQRLQEHLDREREEKEVKAMDRQFGKIFKLKMMDFLGNGQGQGGGGAGPFGGSNSLFSPEMMLLTGNAEMKQTTDDTGKPTGWTIVPKFGIGANQPQQQGQTTQSPMEQMNVMMQTMRSMMEMMNGMQKQNSDPLQQNFTSQIMQVLMNRAFESPSNKLDEIAQTITILDKIKGPASPIGVAGVTNPYANAPPEILKELKQMELDKEFVQMRMQFEREKLQSDQQRAIQQDREAAENTDKIIQAITGIAPTAMAFLQQFMNGNKGQQGQPQPGMMQGQGIDPQEAALRLHFEQQRRAEEERKRKAEEQYRLFNPPVQQYTPAPAPQPQPESQRVIIQERSVYRREQEEEEEEQKEYHETDFMPFDLDRLQTTLREAREKKQRLENYEAAVSSAINSKMLLGESKPKQVIKEETTTVVEEPEEEVEAEQVDLGEILDKAKGQYDPDYDAVKEAEARAEQEEEVEDVEIPDSED